MSALGRVRAATELATVLDSQTVARLIEAAELHAATLARVNDRSGDGELGEDAARLTTAVTFLREVNGSRALLRPRPL